MLDLDTLIEIGNNKFPEISRKIGIYFRKFPAENFRTHNSKQSRKRTMGQPYIVGVVLEALCSRAVRLCVGPCVRPKVCERDVLDTAWSNFTKFTTLVLFKTKMN